MKQSRSKSENLIGQKFFHLTVTGEATTVSRYKNGRPSKKYPCLCDCGKKTFVSRQSLTTGHTKSCGCFHRVFKKIPKGEAGFNSVLYTYKLGAKRRNLSFELTRDEFRNLTKGQCVYCGTEPQTISPNDPAALTEHSKYVYNGIDRIDSNSGYFTENCVTACYTCNIAKKDKSPRQFLEWIKRVAEYQEKNVQTDRIF